MKGILRFFFFWIDLQYRYKKLKEDEEKKEKSVYFGVRAIISSLLGVALAALCAWGFFVCLLAAIGGLSTVAVWVIEIILILLIIVALVNGLISALVCVIYQLKLNHRAIGWVALAIWLACLAGAILIALFLFGKI